MNKNKIYSNDFAYILGVVYGDGHVRTYKTRLRTGGIIVLKVKDKDFALEFKRRIENWSGRKAKIKKYKGFYHTALHSLHHSNIVKKFNISQIPKNDRSYKQAVIRGLFDSDGGIVGENLTTRKKAKRWLHFSNNNLEIINLVKNILDQFDLRYACKGRIHSGFGSKKIQYEIKLYNLKDMFFYYKNIGFSIKRKQKKLKEVIKSYNYYSLESYSLAKKLHKQMGYKKVANRIGIPQTVVYGWLFKGYTDKVLNLTEVEKW